ncbi:hypothetical protein [Acetobacter sp. DsW_063]|uniref:hypothetical protein n=1 Tax=Acetobacter sp. DsW_063 TaxID=1514894 RepID=UPI0011775494|nr:hypothetical protein [Acetobacter sp. DsW_063]
MTQDEFSQLCDCVAKNGNTSHCIRLIGRSLDDLYRFLKHHADERPRLTLALSVFHDDLIATVRDFAISGIPGIRRGEKGAIILGDDGEPVIDRSPNPQLLAAVLRESSARLTRSEQRDRENSVTAGSEDAASSIMQAINSDPSPVMLAVGKICD